MHERNELHERRFKLFEVKLDALYGKMKETLQLVERLYDLGVFSMSELTDAIADLKTKVEADTAADQSAITLMEGLTALVKDLQTQVGNAADVPAALEAVKTFSATLTANQAKLADAVVANTPVAPSPPTP